MSDSTLMAMAERFLSALKHCQLLQMRVAQAEVAACLPPDPAAEGGPDPDEATPPAGLAH